jgi:hypothetical protein
MDFTSGFALIRRKKVTSPATQKGDCHLSADIISDMVHREMALDSHEI